MDDPGRKKARKDVEDGSDEDYRSDMDSLVMASADNDDVFGECNNYDSDSNKSVLDGNEKIVETVPDVIIGGAVKDAEEHKAEKVDKEEEMEEEMEEEGEEENVSSVVNQLHFLLAQLITSCNIIIS
jgi:hypothetical protein